jgi:hypothetical protein
MEHDKPCTERRGDRDRWRNLVLGEGEPLWSGQALDDDDDDKFLFIIFSWKTYVSYHQNVNAVRTL